LRSGNLLNTRGIPHYARSFRSRVLRSASDGGRAQKRTFEVSSWEVNQGAAIPSVALLPSPDCTLRRGFGGFQLYLRLRARPVRFRGDRAGWLNRSAPPRSVAMLASTSRNRRETLSRASPSINSCRPLVTLLRPFGARETIWLASFLLLTGRTINRLFLAPLRYRKPTRHPRWRRPTDNLPDISSVAVLRCSGNEKPKGFVAKSPRARKKIGAGG
jgi:hypothetical protein